MIYSNAQQICKDPETDILSLKISQEEKHAFKINFQKVGE